MSQVVTRQNISEIESVSITGINSGWSVGAVVVPAISCVGCAIIRELVTGGVDLQTAKLQIASSATNLLSLNELRRKFASFYTAELDALVLKRIPREIKQKAAVVRTVAQLGYHAEKKGVIEEKLQAVVKAPPMKVREQVESLMNEVEKQHTAIFTKQIASVVCRASIDAGFKNVEIEYHDALPQIVATDDMGRAVRSEINFDPETKVLDLVSETIGVSDGSCNRIMDKFSAALERHGLKSGASNRRWTGGQCWLTGSKEVDRRIGKKQRQKQLDRTRRLNRISKNQILSAP